jgi:UDP-2,4-diacetamido-2,4,6-trideoxy-beta-L-altropyranose hydrolase
MQIGTGHVMRCLTLANAMRERGANCTFVGREHDGHLMDWVEQCGHTALHLSRDCGAHVIATNPSYAAWLGIDWAADAQQTQQLLASEGVDWLVVDHYALDYRWEQALRPHCKRLMVIDDLADRPHDCDLLLDQNLGRNAADYGNLLKPHTQTLVGPTYALLRPEFSLLRGYSLTRRSEPQLKQILVTMGGVDKDNTTGQVLMNLQNTPLPVDMQITVVMGQNAPWLQQVQAQAAQMQVRTQVLVGVKNMAQIMADSDLAIGGAGSTSWERCCLGLPAALMVLAPNQQAGAQALFKSGAVIVLENPQQVQGLFKDLDSAFPLLKLRQMSDAAALLSSGDGARYVAETMKALHV